MSNGGIPSTDVLKILIGRVPDLAGLLIALVILFSIYQAQEKRIYELQDRYFNLAAQCLVTNR